MTIKKTFEKPNAGTIIQGNVFYGVVWDKAALEVINTTAKALLNLTELFKSQNIEIEAMLKVVDGIPNSDNTTKKP